jgi:hypothetical protein
MSALRCCEMIMKTHKLSFTTSESLQQIILTSGGKYFKASNIERRCRESPLIKSKIVKGNGTKYAVYGWNSQQDN